MNDRPLYLDEHERLMVRFGGIAMRASALAAQDPIAWAKAAKLSPKALRDLADRLESGVEVPEP